ncbi:TPA: hypothetical protein ACH3X1_016264 [Trebouxia sp. C0004]
MPGKHRLYMHCPGLCEDQLYMYLQQFGRVTDVYLPKGLDGQSKGYGFASFESADALSAALDAGEEHAIQGKTVRVNRAGPRPALHLVAASSDPGRQGISHASSAPMSGGVSRQRGGHSTLEPSTSSNMLQNLGSAAGTDNNSSGTPESGPRSAVPQGAGPRIYVGGIPNAVSETMVRKYFSNWGKAAEKAVAQSNREISGYQVASISMTADRIAHYQQVAGGGEEIQRMFQDIEPAHPFALSLQGLLPQLAAVQAQQADLSALAAENIVLGHQQGLPTLSVDNALGPLMGPGGHMNYSLDDSALHPTSFAGLSQQQLVQQQLSQQQLSHHQLGQQQLGQHQLGHSQIGQQQLGQPQLGQPQFGQQQLGRPQLDQQQLGQQQHGQPQQFGQQANLLGRHSTLSVPTVPRTLQYVGAGVLQPQMQEALLMSDISQAGSLSNPGIFPLNVHGMGNHPYSRLPHQHVMSQQAVTHQQEHQATVGQHPTSGPPGSFGHMLSYNSCPLNISSVFRAELEARQHGLGLAQMVGQVNTSGQTQGFNNRSATPPSQEFNPTVGSQRPEDFGPGVMEEHFTSRLHQ